MADGKIKKILKPTVTILFCNYAAGNRTFKVVSLDTRMRTCTAGSVPGWGSGGGQQFELLDRIPENSYHNSRNIPKVKK